MDKITDIYNLDDLFYENPKMRYDSLYWTFMHGFFNLLILEMEKHTLSTYVLIKHADQINNIYRDETFEKVILSYIEQIIQPIENLSAREINQRVMQLNKTGCDLFDCDAKEVLELLKNYKTISKLDDFPSFNKQYSDVKYIEDTFIYTEIQKINKENRFSIIKDTIYNNNLSQEINYEILPQIFYDGLVIVNCNTKQELEEYKQEYNLPEEFIKEILDKNEIIKTIKEKQIGFAAFKDITSKYCKTDRKQLVRDFVGYINLAKILLDLNKVEECVNVLNKYIKPFYKLKSIKWLLGELSNKLPIADKMLNNVIQNLISIVTNEKIDFEKSKEIVDVFEIGYKIEHCTRKDLLSYLYFSDADYYLNTYCSWVNEFISENIDDVIERSNNEQLGKIYSLIYMSLTDYERIVANETALFDDGIKAKVKQLLNLIKNSVPELKNKIFLSTEKEFLDSLVLYFNFIKNNNLKLKPISELNDLIKETELDYLIDAYVCKIKAESAYWKLKQKMFYITYADKIEEIEKNSRKLAEEKILEFKESAKYNQDKYFEIFKDNLDCRYNELNYYCNREKFWNTFNNIIRVYNEKDIKTGFASNEYYYGQLKDISEGAELTPLLVCMIKSIEQMFCACINYAVLNGLTNNDFFCTEKNRFHIKKNIIECNNNWGKTKATSFSLQKYLSDHVVQNIKNRISFSSELSKLLFNWVDTVRNSHMHKDNIYNTFDINKYIEDSYELVKKLVIAFAIMSNG